MENLGNTINNYAQRAAVAAETKMSEWINDVIRFVGELIFQMSYYGILVAQRIFMAIMMIFCPIMFALSLAPPWNSAWSQWMSKFLSLSLWGFVTYMCIYYIDFILLYNLQQDLIAYNHLLHGSVNSWEQIGALGLQGIGSNCMYAMGMLVGAYIIRFVPEVADSGRCQLRCRFSSRQYRDGHDGDGRRYGRKCGRLCSQRCRFSGQTGQIQEQQQQEVITQTIPYAYRIISTENETRPDDGAGHDRWLHPHLRVHRLVLHLARDERARADLHTGR